MAMSTMKKLGIGCGISAGVVVFALLATCIGLGYAIEVGIFPDTVALPAGKIPPRQTRELENMGVINTGEQVQYFYSDAFLSIRADGNLFTDQRVISYQEFDGELEIYEATYDEIESIEFDPSEGWMENSTITVTLHDGTWFTLIVGNESGGDRAFHRKLFDRWKREGS